MKRIFTLSLALCFVFSSYAGTNIVVPKEPTKVNAGHVMIPIGKNGETISLLDLSRMKAKDLEKITGQRMKFIDKVGFAIAQKQLRSTINSDGTINNKKLEKAVTKADDTTGFHLGGFALGFLLGLIGVLIAYLIKDEKKSNRVKWAWIGLAAWLVIWLIFVIL